MISFFTFGMNFSTSAFIIDLFDCEKETYSLKKSERMQRPACRQAGKNLSNLPLTESRIEICASERKESS
ncbi:hypothetical protein KKF38_04345 [Patescibacteria group bacterium]|nr:hypothetical protein [Patescibacteria group bacterium]